ncbi:hypothetical protein Aperf_G00000087501 [Anoplocephala perfoliata]
MSVEDVAIQSIIDELIDSCVMDDIMCIHRSLKLGYSHLLLSSPEDTVNGDNESTSHNSFTKSDSNTRSSSLCVRCAKCNSRVAATRYASHLSNCMGLGRNSSRRANKRIAEQQRFEDSDDVEEPYYLDNSPVSFANHKNESSSVISYPKNPNYPSRGSKSNLRITGTVKSSYGRGSNNHGSNSIPGDSVFEKADFYENMSFSCGDDEESNSSEAPRRSGTSRIRRHQKSHF